MSGNKKRRICAAALCLAVSFCMTACAREEEQSSTLMQPEFVTTEQASYETVQTEMGSHSQTASGTVSVLYSLETELTWEESGAHFQQALVKKGQEVQAGDALMVFAVDGDQTALESLKLQRQRLWEDCETGKQERLAAMEKIKDQCIELESYDLQIANLQLEKLQAEYEAYVYQISRQAAKLTEQITEMEQRLAKNTLVAPYDGVIDYVTKFSEGDLILPDQVLVTMHATDQLLLNARDGSGNLRYNAPVAVEAGNMNDRKTYTGRVVAAANILPSELYQPLILIELDEAVAESEMTGGLKYECTAEEVQDILVVDRAAVKKENDKRYVSILDGNTVQKRYVTTGTDNTEKIWILDGLSEGQTLIVE